MKRKLLMILFVCTLSVNFTACGGNHSETSIKPETSENNNVTPQDTNENSDSEKSNSEKDDMQESDKNDSEDEAKPEETPETIYEIGNSASLKDWTINVTDAQIVDSIAADYGSFSPNEEGNKFIQIFATVNNDGKQADRFLPSVGMGDDVNAKILYSDGYEFTATNLLGYNNDLHDSSINPLSSQTGEIAFEIPSTVADSKDELLLQFSSGDDILKFKIR